MNHQSLQGHQMTSGPSVFVMVDNEKKKTILAKKTTTGLSIVQIILGLTSFLAQITIIILITTESRGNWRDHVSGIGEGVYCGIFFIIAGSLGLLASRKPSVCNISAFMTLSIIASIFSAIQIIVASIKLGVIDEYTGRGLQWKEPKMAMLSMMVLAGVVEMVVAIVCAAICCGACCCSGDGASAGRVVYLAQGENGSRVTPAQMAYLPEANPVTGVVGQTFNEIPRYGNVSERGQVEPKSKSGKGKYMRL